MDEDLKVFLQNKADQFESIEFINDDPICIPHGFDKKEDIEIAGFFAAVIAWGNRKSIIKSAKEILNIMGDEPLNFILNHTNGDYQNINKSSLHRTFLSEDLICFFKRLKSIYQSGNSLESIFSKSINQKGTCAGITHFKTEFLGEYINTRTKKHLPNTLKGSAGKRMNMYLRWMVRSNAKGVDFGIWKTIPQTKLYIPLDVHTGNTARSLNLTKRNQNDWKTLEEIMKSAREVFPNDPAKLDFALFGLGAIEKI